MKKFFLMAVIFLAVSVFLPAVSNSGEWVDLRFGSDNGFSQGIYPGEIVDTTGFPWYWGNDDGWDLENIIGKLYRPFDEYCSEEGCFIYQDFQIPGIEGRITSAYIEVAQAGYSKGGSLFLMTKKKKLLLGNLSPSDDADRLPVYVKDFLDLTKFKKHLKNSEVTLRIEFPVHEGFWKYEYGVFGYFLFRAYMR